MDRTEVDDESLIGDECHIIAQSQDGPRGDMPLETSQRDTYANLILLCKNHHKQVDDQRNFYTINKLQQIKSEHEAWVKETLKTFDIVGQRADEVYATYVEDWEQKSHLEDWRNWTSGLLAAQPYLITEIVDDLRELPRWVLARVWPKRHEKLESAFVNFQIVLGDLLDHFFEYGEKEDWRYSTLRFYKGRNGWNDNYDRDLLRYEFHVDLTHDLTFELTRAANYICDQVRRYVLPSYRIREGRLLVCRGDIRQYYDFCPEYRGAERTGQPYPGLDEFKMIRVRRDFCVGSGTEP